MKQVININFHGQVVPIEVTAFELLKNYTESLSRYFANEEGKEEIINDIESRIGELFQERLKKGSTCITDEDVNAIIKSMGRPEELDELEIWAGGVEGVGHAGVAEADEVVAAGHGGIEFGREGGGLDQFEARGGDFTGDAGVYLAHGHEYDALHDSSSGFSGEV